MDNLTLYNKLISLPENLKAEAADFIDFLKMKSEKAPARNKAKFGSAKGMFVMREGFDDPLEDFI